MKRLSPRRIDEVSLQPANAPPVEPNESFMLLEAATADGDTDDRNLGHHGGPSASYTCMQGQPESEQRSAALSATGVRGWKGLCREEVYVHPTLTLVQLIFSGYHVLTSWALHSKGVDPFVFALYREISASALIALLAVYAVRKGGGSWALGMASRDFVRFLLMGLFSAINVLGAIYALSLITPTNFAVMQPSIPVFTMILSVLCRMEQLTLLKAFGLSCAVAGAICVEVIKPQHGGAKSSGGEGAISASDLTIGNIVVVLQCLGMASLLVAQKTVLSRYHPTVVVMWYYSLGSLITLVVCLAKGTPLHAYQLSTELKPWLALGYAALFGTAFNYNVYSWAGTVVAPGHIAIYSTIQPVGTALLSFLFLGIRPTAGEVMGGLLVVAGLVLTVTARQVEDRVKQAAQERKGSKEAPLCPEEEAEAAEDTEGEGSAGRVGSGGAGGKARAEQSGGS